MSDQTNLDIQEQAKLSTVEDYIFEPIKGYPMLQWKGKRPFTSTQYYPAQLKENHGDPVNGWMNRIYWGDNLQVMSHLLKEFRGEVDLVYIDPPFDSKADYKKQIQYRTKTASATHGGFEEKQYEDIWTNDSYLQFIYERLLLLKELLNKDGIICVHTDWHKTHFIRCILDEVFGPGGFVNEIIWHYYNKMQGNVNRFAANSDTILVYSKGCPFQFAPIREKRSETIKQIQRVWDKEKQMIVNAKGPDGKVLYLDSTHRTIDNVWRMSMLQPADKTENLRYPTQKPEALIARLVSAFSKPGGLVCDCFMGSGTTQAVAMKLGRRFLGADINLGSIQMATKRLIGCARESGTGTPELDFIVKTEEPPPSTFYTGFSISNVNNYDIFRNPAQAKDLLIEALEIQPLPSNALYDGEKDGRMVKILPINRISTKADITDLLSGFDYKVFQKRRDAAPNKPVESLLLVCMGHEPDLAAHLKRECQGFELDVEVVDILRDKANLEFKRDSQAEISVVKEVLTITAFYPMNLLQKLSLMKENVEEWRELTESVMIDWNYDGAVFEPALVDVPEREEFVKGKYDVPADAGTIRVKITDLLSESLEMEVARG